MTPPDSVDDRLLALTAKLYYLDGLGQAEVARMVNVSQAKVSRLLRLARERGIVQITVADCSLRHEVLERQLRKRLDLDEAIVINTMRDMRPPELRATIAHFAAPIVSAMIGDGMKLVVAGGRSLGELALKMRPETPVDGLTVLQGMGNIDSEIGNHDAIKLGQYLALSWNALFLTLNCPALVSDPATRDALLSMDQIQKVRRLHATADVAMVGVGTLEKSVFIERGILQQDDIAALRAAGAVGEIVGRFYDAQGNECDSPYRHRVVSMALEELRVVPQVLAVIAGGTGREAAILAAIRGRLIKSLVIDQAGAESLLATCE